MRILTNNDYKNIIGWDIINWKTFLDFIEMQNIQFKNKKILEIGARDGGLSIFLGLKGGICVCSDVYGPSKKAKNLHKQYGIQEQVIYEAIDATNIPNKYDEYFDIVIFKSVLGGIGSYGNIEKEKACANSIYKCLKPGGILLFAENMQATAFHMFLRKKFKKWKEKWHYETEQEIESIFERFELIDKIHFGFLGCLGYNETLKDILGWIDKILFNRIIPAKMRYIGAYMYKK